MSYFFTVLSPHDKPLFTHIFGTSKGGGDGQPHFNHRTFSSAAIANLAASTTANTNPLSPNSANNSTSATVQYMNQFLVHASLDIVEEIQWTNNQMYLKTVDTYPPTNAHINCWLTGSNVRFLLLYQPNAPTSSSSAAAAAAAATGAGSGAAGTPSGTTPMMMVGNIGGTGRGGMNPGSQQMEEAVKGFMTEVFETWVKCHMNPFYSIGMEVKSPVFRQRVGVAGRKWL